MHLLDNIDPENQDYIELQEAISFSGSALLDMLASVLYKGLPFRFQAKGFSMSPVIKDGDLITVFPLNNSSPGFGDIVACLHPATASLIVHRIVRQNGHSYTVMGDNVADVDGTVSRKDILGIVKSICRKGKETCLGLGPERYLIAFLSRNKLLFPLLLFAKKLAGFMLKKDTR